MSTNTFADWLEDRMQKKGWSQSELHRASGVAKQNISAWITGRNRPNPEQVKTVVAALGADILSAYRALGWLDEPTADTEAQADFIAEFRRRELTDSEVKQLMGTLDMFFPRNRK